MTQKEQIKLYNGQVEITFYPNSHQYRIGKERLKSVTSVTGVVDKSRPLLIWSSNLTKDFLLDRLNKGITEADILEAVNQHNVKRDEAASKGSLVHNWCEQYIKNQILNYTPPEMPEDDDVARGCMAFLDWIVQEDIKFIASEQIVYSRKHNYVGTLDCIFTSGKEDHKIYHLGDFKTSKGVYPEMKAQVRAYENAYQEEHNNKFGDAFILRLCKETGEFEKHILPKTQRVKDFKAFKSMLYVKNWL